MSASWIAHQGQPLTGTLTIPGDKSVSHRAIMLAALAEGNSYIDGFLEGEDARATCAIFRQLGVRIDHPESGRRVVYGVGLNGLKAPAAPLDCGNAGTGMRLLAGLLAGQAFNSTLIGDASLSKRPMRRVMAPLSQMGARIEAEPGDVPPLRITGGQRLHGIEYDNTLASAQVKSSLLLAGLYAKGETTVLEPRPTRDYTERMLAAFGWPITFSAGRASLSGGHRLVSTDVRIPADFSSAAFFLVAATLIPGSELRLKQVGMNPRRIGLLHVLRQMGADIREEHPGEQGGEPVADLVVRHAPLRGIEVPLEHVADMIDEFPILFIAAACAEGVTTIRGAAELRVKESDRISAMAEGLRAIGFTLQETPDGAIITGHRSALQGGEVHAHGDHRIAMAFAVAAQVASGEIQIHDVQHVATSFPGFDQLARGAGFGLRGAA